MTNEQAEQSNFEGWAIVEIFGHQRYAGRVSTQVFGNACMFRVDVPELPAREETAERASYDNNGRRIPPGAIMQYGAVQGYTKLFGVGAIYALTPCTEAFAIKALEQMQPRPLLAVDIPEHLKHKELAAAAVPDAIQDLAGGEPDEDENPFASRRPRRP